jgi:hypothetical protein
MNYHFCRNIWLDPPQTPKQPDPKVSSSFGTAPDIWNWMFAACAKALPAEILAWLGQDFSGNGGTISG